LVVSGALLFILNAGVSRVAIRAGVDATSLTSLRVTGAFVVFAALATALRPRALRPPRGRDLLLLLALGLVGVAALQWTYFVAIDRLPLGVALLLEYTAPVLVALWARFVQHEQVRRRMWIAIALSLGGLALVAQVWRGLAFDGLGVLAGLGAAVCFATYFLLGEQQVNDADPLAVILWSFLVAAVALNVAQPVTSIDSGVLTSSSSLLGALEGWQLPVWALLAWIIVAGTVVPFFAALLALRHLPATMVTMVAMLEPVGAATLGWAWFDETLSPPQLVGAVACRRRHPAGPVGAPRGPATSRAAGGDHVMASPFGSSGSVRAEPVQRAGGQRQR
jgi:drug/metabolite transporter (DMT)-like permease